MRGVIDGVKTEMHMYDHPFLKAQPDAAASSSSSATAISSPNPVDHQPGKPVFSLAGG